MRVSLLSALACAVLSAAVCLILWGTLPRRGAESPAEGQSELDRVREDVGAVRAGQRRLEAEIAGVQAALADLTQAIASIQRPSPKPPGQGESAGVRGGAPGAEAQAQQDPGALSGAPAALEEFDLDGALETLLDRGLSWDQKQRTWSDLAKRGLLDDAVALFEQRARDNPQDPDVHAELGHAYIQKVFTANDVEKMQWSMKANAAYDKALEFDDHHWEARFSKAVNFSFVPPVLGFQSKAIEQFEILRAQQEEQPPREEFAETYVFLGNLYSSQGKSSEAQEVWRQGLKLFPEHRELKDRLPPSDGE